MGNPFLILDTETPPFGIRHCGLCRSCDELVYRHGKLSARCSFMRFQPDAEDGCARWQFDAEAIGEEGMDSGWENLAEPGRKQQDSAA